MPMKTRNNPRNGATDYIRPWTATRWLRGEAEVLGDERDATGLPMRIVV